MKSARRRRMRWRLALRDFTPKTLFGRSMLIIVLPVALMQIAVVFTFFDRHWAAVSTSLSHGVVGDIAMVLDLYSQDPKELPEIANLAREKMNLSVILMPEEVLPTTIRSNFYSPLDKTLRKALAARIEQPFWFDTTRYPSYVDIQVQVKKGVLRFIAPRDRVYATTGPIFVTWLVLATFGLTAIALIFTRAQLRPIQDLAQAAERVGRGQEVPGYEPRGATEVRQAGEAFLQMKNRLSRFINQRTEMLAGVSHDLRTPLTRLKLQLALMPRTGELDAARQDIKDMEKMLDGYLDFARGELTGEPESFDLAEILVRSAQRNVPTADLAELDVESPLPVLARTSAMERVFTNLLENAVRYAGRVWVSAYREDEHLIVHIDDDGPGIPETDRQAAFRPFNRLDAARNMNTEGVGLGLAISRDTVQGHGGDIQLKDSPNGGLRVELRLPVSHAGPEPELYQD